MVLVSATISGLSIDTPKYEGDKIIIHGEASSMGFKPGDWPKAFMVLTPERKLIPFERGASMSVDEGGDLMGFIYIIPGVQDVEMHVLND